MGSSTRSRHSSKRRCGQPSKITISLPVSSRPSPSSVNVSVQSIVRRMRVDVDAAGILTEAPNSPRPAVCEPSGPTVAGSAGHYEPTYPDFSSSATYEPVSPCQHHGSYEPYSPSYAPTSPYSQGSPTSPKPAVFEPSVPGSAGHYEPTYPDFSRSADCEPTSP